MSWDYPEALFALWLLPLLLLARLRGYALGRRAARRFAGPWLVEQLVPRPRTWMLACQTCLFLLGVAMLIVALARPRFGTAMEEVQTRGIDLVILLDVSQSMKAEDVAPNRLRRATSDIRDLLPKLEGDRVGLVAFAGVPLVRVPLTTDMAFVRQVLETIDTDSVTRGGSALGDAIRKALELLPPAADRDQALLLITDGEDHRSFPLKAAERAAQRGVKVFAVGLGDPDQGARIPVRGDDGTLGYLQHQGQEVWSRVDRQLLAEIAITTGGAYVPAHTRAYDLGRIYEDHLEQLTRGRLRSDTRHRPRDRFPVFLALGLALLLLEMVLPRYARATGASPSASPPPAGKSTPSELPMNDSTGASTPTGSHPARAERSASATHRRPLGTAGRGLPLLLAFGLSAFGLAALGLLVPATATGQTPRQTTGQTSGQTADQLAGDGVRQFEQANFAAAQRLFAAAREAEPDNRRHTFNQGCALAEMQRWEEALACFQEAASADEPQLAARALANVGGVLVAQTRQLVGEDPSALPPELRLEVVALCERAVDAYRRSLDVRPEKNSAVVLNLERLRTWLDRTQEAWREADREQRRRESDLISSLQFLRQEQAGVRGRTLSLIDQWPSPRRRQAAFEQAAAQRHASDELDHLQAKFREALTPPSGSSPASASPPTRSTTDDLFGSDSSTLESEPTAVDWVARRMDACREAMQQSARQLDSGQPKSSLAAQAVADDILTELFTAAAPFDVLLQTAITHQEKLVEYTRRDSSPAHSQAADAKDGADAEGADDDPAGTQTDHRDVSDEILEPPREQDRITLWSGALREKALTQLHRRKPSEGPPEPASLPNAAKPNDLKPSDGEPNGLPPESSGDASEPPAPTDQDPSPAAWQAAVKLTPEIEKQSGEATADLRRLDAPAALPHQERALKLLREIARSLPPEQQQQQQQEQQDDQQEQEQDPQQTQGDQQQRDPQQDQDQPSQQPPSSDRQSQGQPSPDSPSQDSQPDNQPTSQDAPDQQPETSDAQEPPAESPPDGPESDGPDDGPSATKDAAEAPDESDAAAARKRQRAQQAELVLRQARERQQRYAELMRQLRARMRDAARVERNW